MSVGSAEMGGGGGGGSKNRTGACTHDRAFWEGWAAVTV